MAAEPTVTLPRTTLYCNLQEDLDSYIANCQTKAKEEDLTDEFPPPRDFSYDRPGASRYYQSSRYTRQGTQNHTPHQFDTSNKQLLLKAMGLLTCVGIAIIFIALSLLLFDGIFKSAYGDPLDETIGTPIAQWHKGEVPYLYQTDKKWGENSYGSGTVSTHGCGPTCLSMVYISLTGKTNYDPGTLAAFSESNGYLDGGITSWLLMSEGAQRIGLISEEIPAEKNTVEKVLSQGRPIICSVGRGDFTNDGHFIVLSGLNADGTVAVKDPNSIERSKTSWELDRILPQCRNLWAYSIGGEKVLWD